MPTSNGFVVKPLEATEETANNDLVADTGFGIFAAACQSQKSITSIAKDADLIEKIRQSALDRIRILRGFFRKRPTEC